MSFRDIRASRAARQPRSFVNPSVSAASTLTSKHITATTDFPQSTSDDSSSSVQPSESQSESPQAMVVDASPPTTSPEQATETAISYTPQPESAVACTIPSGCYSELPGFLSVKQMFERGRSLWTNANIPAGTVLIAVKPHVHALSRSQLKLYCTSCCAPQPAGGFKCSKCKVVHYCGTACQNADWTLHKHECDALKKWAASAPLETNGDNISIPPEAVRCLSRIIWRRKKLGSNSIWSKELDAMQSKREGIAQSMIDAQVHLAHAIVRFMGISGPEELESHGVHGISELVELISKFTLNSFTLTTPSLSPIGVTLAPLAGLLNHSCDPNIAVVFPRCSKLEPELQIVSIRDIPANSELFTSYVDVTLPTSLRRKDLKETYNFTCHCVLCSPLPGKMVDDWREKIWCPNACGAACMLPSAGDYEVRCPKCRASSKDMGDTLDLIHSGQQALDKATSLQSSDPEGALRLVQNMVQLLGTRLPPSSHPLLALIRLGQNLLISQLARENSQTVLEASVQLATAYVKGLSTLLGPGHPVRAVAIAELGKLLAVDEPAPPSYDAHVVSPLNDKASVQYAKGLIDIQVPSGPARLKRAVDVLQQAYTELRIGFGKANDGGEVGKSVHEMLVNLEKELGIWTSGIRNTLEDTIAEQRAKKVKIDQPH